MVRITFTTLATVAILLFVLLCTVCTPTTGRRLIRSAPSIEVGPIGSIGNDMIVPMTAEALAHVNNNKYKHDRAAGGAASSSMIFSPQSFSYIFPLRFQGRVLGWVNDPFLSNMNTPLVAFYYVDYAIGGYRADELWNLTQLTGTPFNQIVGVQDADHHLQVSPVESYFYWHNDTSAYCQIVEQSNTLLDRDTFTYLDLIGTIMIDGVEMYVYNTTTQVPLGYATLVVSSETGAPYSVFQAVENLGVVVNAFQHYVEFEEVQTWSQSSPLWTVPEDCMKERRSSSSSSSNSINEDESHRAGSWWNRHRMV